MPRLLSVGLVLILLLGPILAVGWIMPKRPPTKKKYPNHSDLIIDQDHWQYQLIGSGDLTIVMLHGFGGDLAQWDQVWHFLGDGSMRILRLDLPGFGASRPVVGEYTLEKQIARIKSFVDHLQIDQVLWVGYSMGGSIALALAATYPELSKGAILLAPSAYPGGLGHKGLYGWILTHNLARKIAHFYADSALFRGIFRQSLALPALDITESYGSLWKSKLGDVQCPTLLIWSRTDNISKASFAHSILKAIPRATLRWLPDASAHQILHADGRQIAHYIRDFSFRIRSKEF